MAAAGDPQVRGLAACVPATSLDALTALAGDPDPVVRRALAQAGINTRRLAESNIDALVPLVNDDDPAVYQSVFRSLEDPLSDQRGMHGQHVYLASRMNGARLAEAQAWVKSTFLDHFYWTGPANRDAVDRIQGLTA